MEKKKQNKRTYAESLHIVIENATQLKEKRGPYYEKWKRAMKEYASKIK